MTNIKSGSSDIKFNYNVRSNNSALSGIRANVSNETVTNTKKVETESFYLGTSNDVENKIASEETEITIQTPEQLKKDIASVEQIIDEMQKEVDKIPTYSEYSYHDLVDAGLVNARDEANAKRDELKTYIAQLEYLKKEYQKELNFLKYNDIKETQKYEEFVNNYQINYQDIDFQLFSECGYDINEYLIKKYGEDYKNHDIDPLAIAEAYVDANKDNPNFDINKYATEFDGLIIKVGDEEISAFDFYNYSTKEQQDMYHYLVSTEGTDSANNYLKLIMDDINKNKGYAMAAEYTNTLYLDDENLATNVIDFLSVDAKGLDDGVETFFEGIEQAFKNDGTMSAEDYEKMFVLQYLKENTTLLDDCYEFNNSLGNMVPSMIASAAVSIVATPAAGSVAASALMGLSAAGNAKHDALINGSNTLEANLYAIANGSSEALLGYFLGKIPGISKEAEMSLRALFDEGLEEFSQEWIDAMLRSIFLGEDIDLTQVSEDSAKSFLSGILMAGLLNGGQQMIKMTIDGKTVEINAQKLQEYIDEHPEMPIEDILKLGNELEIDFSKLYDENPNEIAEILEKRGFNSEEIVQMFNDLSKEEIVKVLQENLSPSDINSDIFKINYGDISNITSEQFNNQLNDIKKYYPEYENELNEIQSKIGQNNEITDEMIEDVSKIWKKILTSNNYDPRFTKKGNYARNFEIISNLRKFEIQSDGSYTYYAYENDNRYDFDDIKDVVKYAMKNDLSLISNSDEVLGVLDKQIEDYKKELSNHKINNFYGNKEFINENTDYINKAYNSLCETKYITEQERIEVLKHQKDIENLTKEINVLSKNSKISREDYIKLSDKYQQLLEIEKELSKTNEKAWNRYFEETGSVYIHCYSGTVVSPSEFPAKICTSLLAAEDGSIISNWGVEFRPDFDSIDTISPMDAGSWDYDSVYDFIDRCSSCNGNKDQFSDSMIYYEGGEHSKLFSPEYIENSIPTNKRTYTEIVLKDGTVKPYKYFITENATPEQVEKIKNLAKKDGVEVEVINSKTYERIPLKVYEEKNKINYNYALFK